MSAWEIREGDCIDLMRAMPAESVDAVICDPPYGLNFMGKDWDRPTMLGGGNGGSRANYSLRKGDEGYVPGNDAWIGHNDPRKFQAWCEAWAREALRVLKPGGHLAAFGGTRTSHRLVCAIEDAGFEIRDSLTWLYGSGFPKSLNVALAIDKAAGAVGARGSAINMAGKGRRTDIETSVSAKNGTLQPGYVDAITPEAERWQGWGTALKPAHEPICLARKPLTGTVAQTVLEHGTGALNIDGTRVGTSKEVPGSPGNRGQGHGIYGGWGDGQRQEDAGMNPAVGRWPANVVLDEDAAGELDRQTGGASRFFYTAKASRSERNAGLDDCNEHPTVKPLKLMQWLVRLVTPPGGLILDPFAGSGTTGCAAALEGFDFIGLEREPEYVKIARARITHWAGAETTVTPVRKPSQASKNVGAKRQGKWVFEPARNVP